MPRGCPSLQALEGLCPLFAFLGGSVLRTIGVVTVWAVHLGMIFDFRANAGGIQLQTKVATKAPTPSTTTQSSSTVTSPRKH